MLAFSTFRILPLIGKIAWNSRFLAVLAEPPAESPSTIKISHFSGSLQLQFASFPLLSKEYFGFVSIFVFVFSSAFLIFADFSAQPITAFSSSRWRSKYICSCSEITDETAFAASGLSSFVFVWPSNLGSGCLTETTATRPFLTSVPVKFASFSLMMPSSLAYVLISVVRAVLKPVRWVPPSVV